MRIIPLRGAGEQVEAFLKPPPAEEAFGLLDIAQAHASRWQRETASATQKKGARRRGLLAPKFQAKASLVARAEACVEPTSQRVVDRRLAIGHAVAGERTRAAEAQRSVLVEQVVDADVELGVLA